MKKKVAIIVVFAVIILAICITIITLKGRENSITPSDTDGISTNEASESYLYDTEFTLSYANWTGEAQIYFSALNNDKFAISSVQHLPIYKFDTKNDLDNFKQFFGEILSVNQSYDEVPSFDDATVEYDESFFSENSLILVYVPASSGSFRFGVREVYCDGKALCVHVEQTNSPEICTDDMAGWFITVPIEDALIKECEIFDADLNNY